MRAFYNEKNQILDRRQGGSPPDLLFADAPPVEQTAVDDDLLTSVLGWLCSHPDVELRDAVPNGNLAQPSEREAATSAVALQLKGRRVFTTEDRIWHAIAGHGPDSRRIPPLEFDILSIVAAHGSMGILQPTITKLTGQDKRSVPKRTDRLQEKGYISKETVVGGTGKTSLLRLKRFSRTQSLEDPLEENANHNLRPVVHYDRMYNTMMRMLQENNGVVATHDLRLGLGIGAGRPGRWEGKILARCIRRLEKGGCIRRVTAKMADAQGNAMDTIGHQKWRRARAVQLMRPPTQYDRLLWEQSDPHMKMTASDDEEEREDTVAGIDAVIGSDDDDDLVEVGAVEEVTTSAEQLRALGQKATEADADGGFHEHPTDLDRTVDRIPPQWTPNLPLVNILFNKIDEAGESGISSNQLQAAVVGPLWKRPMDESLAHLTDVWQHSQPPHLRHLTVVRDTAVFGRSAQFKYRTLLNFEKAVAAGKAAWTAVLDETSAKAKNGSPQVEPDLDRWGFPKIPPKALHGHDGRATLLDGRKGIQVERMLDHDAEPDDFVVDDDVETPAAVPPSKPIAKRAKGMSARKRKSVENSESATTTPVGKAQRSVNGFNVNGKKIGRRPKDPTKARFAATAEKAQQASGSSLATALAVEKGLESSQHTWQHSHSSAARKDLIDDGSTAIALGESRLLTLALTPTGVVLNGSSGERDQPVMPTEAPVAHDALREFDNKLTQRPVTTAEYIPRYKSREIKPEEYTEYRKFATKTAENRVRLELSASRKRTAGEAKLSSGNNANAKKQRTNTGEASIITVLEDDVSKQLAPVPVDQLSSTRINSLYEEILDRQKPGVYINPPGAKNVKAANFPTRGRPRKAKIAVFKSERLHEMEWYRKENGPRYASSEPSRRQRTSIVGNHLETAGETVEDSASDGATARHANQGQNISAKIVEDSDSDYEIARPSQTRRKVSASILEDSDSENASPVRKRRRRVQPSQAQMNVSSARSEVVRSGARASLGGLSIFDTAAMARDSVLNGAVGSAGVPIEPEGTPDTGFANEQTLASRPNAMTSEAVDKALDETLELVPQSSSAPLPANPSEQQSQAVHTTSQPKPKSQDADADQPLSKNKSADTASFYLAKYPVEERATPQQQHKLLSAKPGRKSKRDLEILADLEQTIGFRSRTRAVANHSKLTKTPDPVSLAESRRPLELSVEQRRVVGSTAAAPTRTGITSVNAAQSEPVADDESSDDSETDEEDWTGPRPPVGPRNATTPSPSDRLSLQQALEQAVMPQPFRPTSRPTADELNVPVKTAQTPRNALSLARHAASLPRMTTPVSKVSPLMIVRPYETPDRGIQERPQESAMSAEVPGARNKQDENGLIENYHADIQVQHPDEVEDEPIRRGGEDDMGICVSEQANGSISEVPLARAVKPLSTTKKTGGSKLGGSTQIKRHEIMLSAVQQCGGVFPGDTEMWYVLATSWKKLYDRMPDRHSVERAVEQLMSEKKLKRFKFAFKSKSSSVITKQILAEPSVKADDEIVTQLRKQMMKSYPLQYLPMEVDIDDELRESASSNKRGRKPKIGDPTPSKPRAQEYPQDPVLIVQQTAIAAAKADQDAQSKGFANAQALRQHMQELNAEAKSKSWQKRTDRQRKEREETASREPQVATDLANVRAEILGTTVHEKQKRRRRKRDPVTGELLPLAPLPQIERTPQIRQSPFAATLGACSGDQQLAIQGYDHGVAPELREAEAEAPMAKGVRFEKSGPEAKSMKPVRQTRRPLGSIRGPAAAPIRRRWWEDEKRLRQVTAAHLMSPAQNFTPSNGTFGTSGRGMAHQVAHWRAAPGTLSREEYQKETAQAIAHIQQIQQQAFDETTEVPRDNVGAPALDSRAGSTMVTFNISQEQLNGVESSQHGPISAVLDEDEDASVYEAAARQSSVDMSPEPGPEPELPKTRRKYTSRKKKQIVDDEAVRESDNEFLPGAASEFVDEQASGKMPKLKGPGVRGVRRAFTTRDRQASQGFKDVSRLVVAIALVSAIAGGLSQDKLSWNVIAHALSYRYEGDFLRRRWEHYRRSRRGDVERIRDAIRPLFLKAYERDELPIVNLQASHETDWPALHEWVMKTVPMKMSVTVDDRPDVPDLPATKALLEEKFTVSIRNPVFELNRDDYYTTITDQNRRHIAQRLMHGEVLLDEIKPCEDTNNELLLAKSWVRAVAMTKQHKYVAKSAAEKISVLGNKVLKRVSSEMMEAKMFLQDKRGRQLPGRNFQIHHEVLVQFRRWPATRDTDEHRYLCALAESWTHINDYFRQTDELVLTPITSDQDYTILTNLVASGMVTIAPVFPEIKWNFDAPAPRLSPWGYSGNSYQTKKADQSQLKYDLVYTKTSAYQHEHELTAGIPIPLVPPTIEGEPGPRIPFWVDIHGNLIDDIWDMCFRSVLHLIVFRSGMRAITMQLAHSHKLWQWEIEMILGWMERVGIAVRYGEGEEVNGIWSGGWGAGKWWYCAFLPEMITWEAPLAGGFVEIS